MSLPTPTWAGRPTPLMRCEAHFDDRVVRCFAQRPASVDRMFCDAVARYGDRDAVVHDTVRLSYAELADAVEALARGFRSAGVEAGDRVVLLIGNRPEFIITLLAIQRLRAIAVPVSIREQSPGIGFVLHQCGARLLIHDADLADRIPRAGEMPAAVTVVSLDDSRWQQWLQRAAFARQSGSRGGQAGREGAAGPNGAGPHEAGPAVQSEEDTAVILYTSGTTGKPKGAMLSHLNIVHSAMHYEFCMDLGPADRSAVAVPATHVTGLVGMIMAMIRVGGALVLISSFKARAFLELAAAQRITHTILVPAMYQLCLLEQDLSRFDLRAWRVGAYGGAPMPRSTIEALARALPGMTLMNAYGATETTSPATIMPRRPAGRTIWQAWDSRSLVPTSGSWTIEVAKCRRA